jgi:hypothetical protein
MGTRLRWLAGVAGVGVVGGAVAGLLLLGVGRERQERESHTLVEAVKKVARLTTVEMNVSSFELRKDVKHLFGVLPFKCEKTVAVFYRGKVAAGFDLDDKTALTVTVSEAPHTRRLEVVLPEPRVLYTDAPAPEVVVADGSQCNRLEAEDYQRLTNEARTAVERQALAGGILKQAESHARELVTALGGPLGYEVVVKTRSPALSIAR